MAAAVHAAADGQPPSEWGPVPDETVYAQIMGACRTAHERTATDALYRYGGEKHLYLGFNCGDAYNWCPAIRKLVLERGVPADTAVHTGRGRPSYRDVSATTSLLQLVYYSQLPEYPADHDDEEDNKRTSARWTEVAATARMLAERGAPLDDMFGMAMLTDYCSWMHLALDLRARINAQDVAQLRHLTLDVAKEGDELETGFNAVIKRAEAVAVLDRDPKRIICIGTPDRRCSRRP